MCIYIEMSEHIKGTKKYNLESVTCLTIKKASWINLIEISKEYKYRNKTQKINRINICIWDLLGFLSEKKFFLPKYRVFFIEGQIRIICKMLQISLFHVGSGLKTEVTMMGDLISDQIKSPNQNVHINLQKLQL